MAGTPTRAQLQPPRRRSTQCPQRIRTDCSDTWFQRVLAWISARYSMKAIHHRRSRAAYDANSSDWGKSSAAAPPRSSPACAAGTRSCRHSCSGLCPSAPGSSGSGAEDRLNTGCNDRTEKSGIKDSMRKFCTNGARPPTRPTTHKVSPTAASLRYAVAEDGAF